MNPKVLRIKIGHATDTIYNQGLVKEIGPQMSKGSDIKRRLFPPTSRRRRKGGVPDSGFAFVVYRLYSFHRLKPPG